MEGPGPLCFEFWNDRQFQAYAPEDQKTLTTALLQPPRPPSVGLGGGRYVLRHFDAIESSGAEQVNQATGFQRPVRLQPPYQLPGFPAPQPLPPIQFHFIDDCGWRPLGPRLQDELKDFANCAPVPWQAFFGEGKHVYIMMGLELLRTSDARLLNQKNYRTGTIRSVRAIAASDPLAVAPVPGPPTWPRQPQVLAPPVRFGLRSASIAVTGAHRSPAGAQVFTVGFADQAREVVIAEWRKEPRPATVVLPSGDIIERFDKFELGLASVKGREGTAVEVRFEAPQLGIITLPDELDLDAGFSLGNCGRCLSDAEVAALAARGPEASKCSICLSEMELAEENNHPQVEEHGESNAMAVPAEGCWQPAGQSCSAPSQEDGSGGRLWGLGSSAASASDKQRLMSRSSAASHSVFELQCGHNYHTDCIKHWFGQRKRCPQCQKDYGKVVGDQPRRGSMSWGLENFALAGHQDWKQTIVVCWNFPGGSDLSGRAYNARNEKGYLPCNAQGIVLLELFKLAFKRCVMFGLGTSMSLGSYRPTFNIHIKSSTNRGAAHHGYPDDSYFERSLDELRSNGICIADLPV